MDARTRETREESSKKRDTNRSPEQTGLRWAAGRGERGLNRFPPSLRRARALRLRAREPGQSHLPLQLPLVYFISTIASHTLLEPLSEFTLADGRKRAGKVKFWRTSFQLPRQAHSIWLQDCHDMHAKRERYELPFWTLETGSKCL